MQITWTFHSCHVKTHAAWMTFHMKTLEGEDLVFMLLALEVDTTKLIFHNIISVSKFYMAHDSPNGTCTFLHSYA